jgi:hypothetical protein
MMDSCKKTEELIELRNQVITNGVASTISCYGESARGTLIRDVEEKEYIDFGDGIREIHDSRQRARIPTSAIWMNAFFMFALNRGSLNAIESELRVAKRLDGLLGSHKPSADRMGDVFGLIPSEELRAMLSEINHQLGRNKVFGKEGPWRFVALDGHEFFSQSASLLYSVFSAEGEGS